MTEDTTPVTVADLVKAVDRIEQWIRVVRKGIEALPQDQLIKIDPDQIESPLDLKQPFITEKCR